MMFPRPVAAAVAVSMMVCAPAVSAQTTTAAEARSQMQQYCAQTAQRTDEAGRAYHAANCGPAMMRADRPVLTQAGTAAAVLFGLGVLATAIFVRN